MTSALIAYGTNHTLGTRKETPAFVFDDFAAHMPHRIESLSELPIPIKNAGWTVSHVPSGLSVTSALRTDGVINFGKHDAIAWARAAEFVCRVSSIDTKKVATNDDKRTLIDALRKAWAVRGLL